MRECPEDFLVEEVPAYPPCGHGTHLFVQFEKSGLTTPAAVSALATSLGVPAQRASYAGLKDRHAITRQWASFEGGDPSRLPQAAIPGIQVLAHAYHTNKLKTGHLKGNRFTIRVRNPQAGAEVAKAIFAKLDAEGCPNYYGEQRFGQHGDNAQVAIAFLTGQSRAPRDRFKRRLLFSAFQAELFNRWLADRVERGELATAIAGDLMRREDSGGLFTSDDLDDLKSRSAEFAISATGPMFGADMRRPLEEAWAREERLLAESGVDEDMLSRWQRLGAGTRRACRVRPMDVRVESEPDAIVVHFELPKGAYATTIMREVMKTEADDQPT